MKKGLLMSLVVFCVAAAQGAFQLTQSQHWQIRRKGAGKVKLTGPVQSGLDGPTSIKDIFVTNPRITRWFDQTLTWDASKAAISPKEKNVFIVWTDRMPKYTSYEIDYVSLETFRVQKLPASDLRNSGDLPIWSPDERYAAASGGNTIRLWTLSPELRVAMLPTPQVGKLRVSYASNVRFGKDGKTLLSNYELILPNNYADSKSTLLTTYSVPDGRILSTKVITTP